MPQTSRQPLAALLTLSCGSLGMSQTTFGQLLGVSRTTMCRWMGGRTTGLLPSQLETLVRALLPVDADLASEVAACCHETPESLGLVAKEPPPPPPPRVPLEHLVDSVVCAAADAVTQPPASLRPSLRAAFARAQSVGLSVDDLVNGLREKALKAPSARDTRD